LTETLKRRIDEILRDDQSAPRKQRHTAVAIHRRLVQEENYVGGYDQVRRYVGKNRRRERETFIPLSHDPGQRAEADFGHIYVDFPDGRRQVAVLIITWAWSNCSFAIALPSEKVEAILHGTREAFEFFGCVPKELWWDNPKTVVKTIFQGRERELNEKYLALASHYNFEPLFCLPARGNEKPHVENRVKFLQRNWATPLPQVQNLDELNAHLRACYLRDLQRTTSGQRETIGARFAQEKPLTVPLPARGFDAAVCEPRKADKYQTVAWDTNRYSVPRRFAFQTVTVKAYVDRIEIVCSGQVIAQHERCYQSGQQVLDPLHYLATLSRKPACLDHSDVYRNWKLPAEFTSLREHLETRHGPLPGARQFIRVLQLLAEHPLDRVTEAVRQCRREEVLTAERIIHRCQRLAESAKANQQPAQEMGGEPMANNHRSFSHQVPVVQVPLPDLSRFDCFLTFTQGREIDEQARCLPVVENQSETAPPADDPGGAREVGPRGGREQPGLSGLPLASDRVGIGDASWQCAGITHATSWFPSAEGSRYV
jgi:transposase